MARLATWTDYRESIGDRSAMFAALVEHWGISRALYVGSYVDLSPSTAIPTVTYVDTDRRAARLFADEARVRDELAGRRRAGAGVDVRFIAADFTEPLAVPDQSVDLLISLFTVPAWQHCRRYVREHGWLLANTSHGEASLAALDPSLRLAAVVHQRGGRYRVTTDELTSYLVPQRPEAADADTIRRTGRGVAYTRSAFAYLFEQV